MPLHSLLIRLAVAFAVFATFFAKGQEAQPRASTGALVSYQLPTDGPLPRTYRVTLAIVDPKNPDWIVSQFACGVARTVTAENGGKFSENWDGLDDNFMPVPPGSYGVRGIYMPARQWQVDGEWHSITPKFHSGASPWLPSPDDWQKPEPFGGDPVGSPLRDVSVGANGVAVFYYQYLENGLNNPMIDLKKPLGYDQFIRAFNSGGAAGGTSVTTDGETVWAYCAEGGPKYVYRADGKSFGHAEGAARPNSYKPEGWVTAMAVWHDGAAKPVVFISQRGKMMAKSERSFVESDTEFVDKVTALDGANGNVLAELPLARPRGLAVQAGLLYALHAEGSHFAVSTAKLANGLPSAWQRLFVIPQEIHPASLAVDSHARVYVSDSDANHVFQFDRSGKILRKFGRLDAQKPGAFDPQSFIAPDKLATWTAPDGGDRLLVVENGGPNRVTEWGADGNFVREFLSLQTRAADGYAFDPEHPDQVYLPGQQNWLTRFRVDFEKHTWTIDAVWPDVGNDPRTGPLDRMQLIRANGQLYLAGRRSYDVYRLDGDRWLHSAAILRDRKDRSKPPAISFWHDTNGDGRIDEGEITPAEIPSGVLTYHGQRWLEDFSLLAPAQGGTDVWRLAPSGFDAHGNPIFKKFEKLITDPIFVARTEGKADAIHGGNELAEKFTSDWMGADGTLAGGFYVQARGGKNFSANEGAQHKISRYVPDGAGSYRLKWRTGRTALQWLAHPGEIYGAMRIQRPINGLVSVIDQSRCGILLYTEDGLYVDTIFPDGRRVTPKVAGIYPQPGEFFTGEVFQHPVSGRIYFEMGKYTALLFEAEGWSAKENPVKPIAALQKTVTISVAQISTPPEIALSLRGGAGAAKVARFAPALGTVAFDGSMSGWESCEPAVFQADKGHTVEVRCLYRPDFLYLRWHARLGAKFEPRPLPSLERIFTHDQLADTLSFYIQGDLNAKPNGPAEGRPGDARFVFGIFKDTAGKLQPVGIAMYPERPNAGAANPQVYRTPVGQAKFAHVGPITGARFAHTIDSDGDGFVFLAAIPRAAIPRLAGSFGGGYRTLVDFEATFGGHNKFWWANSDGSASRETYDEPTEARLYPGAWAPALFGGIDGGVVIKNWLVCGPFGGPGAEKFKRDLSGLMPGTKLDWKTAARNFCEAQHYPPDDGKVDASAVFKGDVVQGYWPPVREVRWKPETIADLDTRIILGACAQVWYAATWIRVPAAIELEFRFQGHPMTPLRWFLNGQPVQGLDFKPDSTGVNRTLATKTLTLRAGWNEVMFRGYCVGYPPFRAGLVLDASPEKLWDVQLSGTPPEGVGSRASNQ